MYLMCGPRQLFQCGPETLRGWAPPDTPQTPALQVPGHQDTQILRAGLWFTASASVHPTPGSLASGEMERSCPWTCFFLGLLPACLLGRACILFSLLLEGQTEHSSGPGTGVGGGRGIAEVKREVGVIGPSTLVPQECRTGCAGSSPWGRRRSGESPQAGSHRRSGVLLRAGRPASCRRPHLDTAPQRPGRTRRLRWPEAESTSSSPAG